MRYRVVLEKRLNGSAAGSTSDVVEADSESEAIEMAKREWKLVEPRFSYGELFSAPALDGESVTLTR